MQKRSDQRVAPSTYKAHNTPYWHEDQRHFHNWQNSPKNTSRVYAISQFAQETRLCAPHLSPDHQRTLQQSPAGFRRSQGYLTKIANHVPSHNNIVPAGKRFGTRF